MADAAAEELRERLMQLAKQLVDLQVTVAQKDAQLAAMAKHKSDLEARLGVGAGGERRVDYVPRGQHEDVTSELTAVKKQLIECLEELSAREREVTEVGHVGVWEH